MRLISTLVFVAIASPLAAQLTPEQRQEREAKEIARNYNRILADRLEERALNGDASAYGGVAACARCDLDVEEVVVDEDRRDGPLLARVGLPDPGVHDHVAVHPGDALGRDLAGGICGRRLQRLACAAFLTMAMRMIVRVIMISRMVVAASVMSMRSLDGAIGHRAKPLSERGTLHTLKLL